MLHALEEGTTNPIALLCMPSVPKEGKKQHLSLPALSEKQLRALKREICLPSL